VESVAAVLDADVEQSQGQHGHVGIAVVDILDNSDGGFARSVSLLSIDQVGNLEIEGEVWFEVLRVAGGICPDWLDRQIMLEEQNVNTRM
jgi:hypothetical protein